MYAGRVVETGSLELSSVIPTSLYLGFVRSCLALISERALGAHSGAAPDLLMAPRAVSVLCRQCAMRICTADARDTYRQGSSGLLLQELGPQAVRAREE